MQQPLDQIIVVRYGTSVHDIKNKIDVSHKENQITKTKSVTELELIPRSRVGK